jgi:hypothetical protein
MTTAKMIEANYDLRDASGIQADLEGLFFPTDDFTKFNKRLFGVLEAREERLKRGLFEQKGAALIGPPGSGKSRMVREAIAGFHAVAEATGGREYGHQIISVVVPGRASVKDTSKEILRKFGYRVNGARDDDYLFQKVKELMKEYRIAGLHLDEVQDAGRYATTETMDGFAKRFRNLTQDEDWPVCLFLSATLEGRAFINHDSTLTRRLRPIEIRPMTLASEGRLLRDSVTALLQKSGFSDEIGLLEFDEFLKILMHAAAYRFGLAIEMTIEAIGEAIDDGSKSLQLDYFAGAYFLRTDCDDDMNPFMTPHWKGIDATKALARKEEPDPPPARKRGGKF